MLVLVRYFRYATLVAVYLICSTAGLSGFAIFISIVGILLPLFMLLVPVIDVKYGRLTHLSRALAEVRVGFILTCAGTGLTLLIAYVLRISPEHIY